MPLIETIKVQTTGAQLEQECQNFLTALKQEIAESDTYRTDAFIRLYRHATLPGQYMVWLEWHSKHPEPLPSDIARIIIHELKQFGLVDQSAWVLSD